MSRSEQGDILIRELFAGEMTPERHAELEAWLREDPANTELLAEFAVIERLLFVEQKQMDASAILALLLEEEQNAEPMLVTFHSAEDMRAATDEPFSFKRAIEEVGYELSKRLRTNAGFVAGTAAVLVAALVLVAVLLTGPGGTPAVGPIASTPTPDEAQSPTPTPTPTNVVATLTAERDATWQAASGTVLPSVGQNLYAGQNLTLTSGFAEVTTARGAVAVLEAPCNIELMDGGNALRLTSGKLIGICETPSSKGFLVRTPHMDIIDLGTRFGVDASQADSTQVQIFEGEVKVAIAAEDAATEGRVLSAGQAVLVSQDSNDFFEVEKDAERFASLQAVGKQFGAGASEGLAGVSSISGDLEVASAEHYAGLPDSQWPTTDNAVIFHDFIGRLLKETRVNVAEPGQYDELKESMLATVPLGTDLRSYVILKTGNADGTATKVRGSVTFEGEVVGIITDQTMANSFADAIRTTSPIFSPGANGQRWIDANSFEEGFGLSEDRRTVTFEYHVKQSSDAIRVLVRHHP